MVIFFEEVWELMPRRAEPPGMQPAQNGILEGRRRAYSEEQFLPALHNLGCILDLYLGGRWDQRGTSERSITLCTIPDAVQGVYIQTSLGQEIFKKQERSRPGKMRLLPALT